MTDFLTQLVARSSGSAKTIRPRLPSVFEPTWPAMGAVAGSANSPEIFDDQPLSEETPFEARPSAERPRIPVAESLAGQPEHRLHSIEPEPAVLPAKPEPEHRLHEIRRDPAVLPEERKSAPMASLAPLPESAMSQSPSQAHVIQFYPAAQATWLGAVSPETPTLADGPGGEVQAGSPSASGDAAYPQSEHAAAQKRNSALGLRPLDESYLLPKPIPTNSTVLSRASAARESDRARASAPRSAKDSEPVIQVTIGRIEVRAVSTPVPTTSKDRSAPTVVSLDQYLRQRSQRVRE